jgi:hypothetical protein
MFNQARFSFPWRLALIFLILSTLVLLVFNVGYITTNSPLVKGELSYNHSIINIPDTIKLHPFSDFGQSMIKYKESYSSVHCRHRLEGMAQCLFSNVAIKDRRIVFYEDPENPVDFISSRIRKEFPKELFIGVRAGYVSVEENEYFDIERVQTPIPTSAFYVDSHLSVLYKPHAPNYRSLFIAEV